MQFLIIARHGEAGDDKRLTPEGRAQIVALAAVLEKRLEGKKICLLSSPRQRTLESAKGLEIRLNVAKTEVCTDLADGEVNTRDILALVRTHEADFEAVILMAHEPLGRTLPPLFCFETFGAQQKEIWLTHGQACFINCVLETVELLP